MTSILHSNQLPGLSDKKIKAVLTRNVIEQTESKILHPKQQDPHFPKKTVNFLYKACVNNYEKFKRNMYSIWSNGVKPQTNID